MGQRLSPAASAARARGKRGTAAAESRGAKHSATTARELRPRDSTRRDATRRDDDATTTRPTRPTHAQQSFEMTRKHGKKNQKRPLKMLCATNFIWPMTRQSVTIVHVSCWTWYLSVLRRSEPIESTKRPEYLYEQPPQPHTRARARDQPQTREAPFIMRWCSRFGREEVRAGDCGQGHSVSETRRPSARTNGGVRLPPPSLRAARKQHTHAARAGQAETRDEMTRRRDDGRARDEARRGGRATRRVPRGSSKGLGRRGCSSKGLSSKGIVEGVRSKGMLIEGIVVEGDRRRGSFEGDARRRDCRRRGSSKGLMSSPPSHMMNETSWW